MMRKWILLAAVPLLATGGCVAKAAWDVATLPVKAGGAVVDGMTTSPKERDEKWVRQQRKAAEREEKERAEWGKKCRKNPDGCGVYDGFRAPYGAR